MSGLHGYLSHASVSRGQQLEIYASNDGPLRLLLMRLAVGQVKRQANAISATVPVSDLGRVDCDERHVCCGSYVHVADASVPTVFALEVWFRQLAHRGCAGLISHDRFALLLGAEGRLEFRLGELAIGVRDAPALKIWHHAWTQCDANKIELFLDGNLVGSNSIESESEGAGAREGALRMGALLNDNAEVDHLLTR